MQDKKPDISTVLRTVFSRPRGKSLAKLAGCTLCVGAVTFARHTVLLEFSQKGEQAERDGVSIEPAPKLQVLLEKAASDLKLSDSEKKSVKLFCSKKGLSDIWGTVKYSYGMLLGVPSEANADSVADITLPKRLVNDKKSKIDQEKIQKLKEASVLSDAAKLYVMAEGLLMASDSGYILQDVKNSCFATVAALLQGAFMFRFAPHLAARLKYLIYLAIWLGWIGISKVDTAADREDLLEKRIDNLSLDYVNGGLEFYDKLLMRQQLSKEMSVFNPFTLAQHQQTEEIASRRRSALRKLKEKSSWE